MTLPSGRNRKWQEVAYYLKVVIDMNWLLTLLVFGKIALLKTCIGDVIHFSSAL